MSTNPPDLSALTVPNDSKPTNDLWEVIFSQRAIRYWQEKPVPRALLETVVAAAARAPSGSNSQPWQFVVVDDPDRREQIGAALKAVFDAAEPLKQMVEAGAESKDRSERLMLKGAKHFFSQLDQAPVIILPCLYRLSSPTQDPTTLLAGSSIYLAVQNLLLAARALGLGTVMTTAQTMIEPALRSILSLPDDANPVALIPLGYPAAKFGPTKRKPVAEILHWNHW